MKTKEQLKRGIMRFVSNELAPKMSVWAGIALEAFAPAVIEAKIETLLSTGWLSGTAFVNGNTVNVDEVYKALKTAAASRWPFEMFGFQFTESDLDKVYTYIREA